MKNKLKYLFLLVLGLFFIPSTFAFELKNFNDNPEEVEVVSSKEYNGTTYYYKRISWGDFFQCIEKNDVINETNSGDYVSSPATPAMTCPTGKVMKFRRWRNNFYWGYRQNWSQPLDWEIDFWYYGYNRLQPQFYLVRNWFWWKFFMIQQLKNDKGQSAFMYWQADYRWAWKLTTSIGSSQYMVGLPNMYWVHMFKSGQEEVEGSTFFQWKFRLHKMILTNYYTPSNINYETVPVVLIDTHKHLVYEYASDIKDLLKNNFQYMDLRLLDNCPAKIREYHFWAWTEKISFNWDLFSKKGGYSILNTNWRDLTEKECATYKKDIKDRMIYNMDYLNFMRGATDKSNSGSVAEDYNKCSSSYSDIKALAYYSKACWEDPADDTTLNRVKVDSWDAEGDVKPLLDQLTGVNKNKCGRFANAKKKYKEKYAENWESWYKSFSDYAWTPEAIDIQALCRGVELEHGSAGVEGKWAKWFFTTWTKAFLDSLKWAWKNNWNMIEVWSWFFISQNSFERDMGHFSAYYKACQDKRFLPTPYDKFWDKVKQSFFWWWDNNENVCKYKDELAKKYDEKYSKYVFSKSYRDAVGFELWFSLFDEDWRLNLRQKQKWFDNVSSVFDWFAPDSLWLEKVWDFFKKDYKAGYDKAFSAVGYKHCWIWLNNETWDYLVYLPLILLVILVLWRL